MDLGFTEIQRGDVSLKNYLLSNLPDFGENSSLKNILTEENDEPKFPTIKTGMEVIPCGNCLEFVKKRSLLMIFCRL